MINPAAVNARELYAAGRFRCRAHDSDRVRFDAQLIEALVVAGPFEFYPASPQSGKKPERR